MMIPDLLTAMQDASLPSRKHSEPGYSGLFGPHPAFDPMRLLFLLIMLLLVTLMGIVLYHECVISRKQKGYSALYGAERT
jgi:hypothetical protein